MTKYWGVIRIWYVSTTCKSNDILLQYYYVNEGEILKFSIPFLLIFRQSGDVLFFHYARRLRGYTATLPPLCKGHSHGQPSVLFSMRSAHRWLFCIEITSVESSQDDQSPVLFKSWLKIYAGWWGLMNSPRVLRQVTEYIRKFYVVFFSARKFVVVSVLNGNFDEVK